MVRHKNATPELLAWIVSNARDKDNPGGWAVEAIRTPYEPSNGRQKAILQEAKSREISEIVKRAFRSTNNDRT